MWSAVGNRGRGRVLDQGIRRTNGALSHGELGSQPDPYTRAILQSALGRDLGDVRVRTGRAVRAVLDPLGVDALAQGGVVTIRREHDRPETLAGRALLLHELVHVLQQADLARSGRQANGSTGAASAEVLEEQARSTSIGLAARAPLPVRHDDAEAPGPPAAPGAERGAPRSA